ncbi:hypothetical protein D3C87_1490490 [compost metagenome]
MIAVNGTRQLGAGRAARGVVCKRAPPNAGFIEDAGQRVGEGSVLVDEAASLAVGVDDGRQVTGDVKGISDDAAVGGGDADQLVDAVVAEGQDSTETVADAGEAARGVIGVGER